MALSGSIYRCQPTPKAGGCPYHRHLRATDEVQQAHQPPGLTAPNLGSQGLIAHRESFYSSVCPVSAKLLSCCERRPCRQGLLEGLEDVKSALASAYSSLLRCQFPPAWEDEVFVSASSDVCRNMEP